MIDYDNYDPCDGCLDRDCEGCPFNPCTTTYSTDNWEELKADLWEVLFCFLVVIIGTAATWFFFGDWIRSFF